MIKLSKFKFISNKKKDKFNIFNIKEDLVNANTVKGIRIEILSNKNITVEGIKGVFDYKDDYIKLKLKKGYLIICGRNFFITYYENETITVSGIISNIEFC